MIIELDGDLLLSQAQAIAHGIAPNDNFDSGLALSLRERWPALYKDFRHYCHLHSPRPGSLWAWSGVGGPRIVSLFTQAGSGNPGGKPGKATVENVRHSLKELAHWLAAENIQSLALPRLATGVGGLDWAAVQPLVAQALADYPGKVYVYTTFHPDVAGAEVRA